MKLLEKQKARELRKQGKSINEIVKEAGLSKASVSDWVRDINLTHEQRKRISEKGRSFESVERRRKSRLENERAKRKKVFFNETMMYYHILFDHLNVIIT